MSRLTLLRDRMTPFSSLNCPVLVNRSLGPKEMGIEFPQRISQKNASMKLKQTYLLINVCSLQMLSTHIFWIHCTVNKNLKAMFYEK